MWCDKMWCFHSDVYLPLFSCLPSPLPSTVMLLFWNGSLILWDGIFFKRHLIYVISSLIFANLPTGEMLLSSPCLEETPQRCLHRCMLGECLPTLLLRLIACWIKQRLLIKINDLICGWLVPAGVRIPKKYSYFGETVNYYVLKYLFSNYSCTLKAASQLSRRVGFDIMCPRNSFVIKDHFCMLFFIKYLLFEWPRSRKMDDGPGL